MYVCLSVCVSVCPRAHAYITRTRMRLGGVVGDAPYSYALLGGFAIGARVALLWQHNANAKCYSEYVLVLALYA